MASTLSHSPAAGQTEDAPALLAGVLDASTEHSIIAKDLHGKILLWNEGARRMYGYEAQEVANRSHWDILHLPEDAARGRPGQILEAALRQGKWEGVLAQAAKDGRRLLVRAAVTPRRDETGKPIGFLLIAGDLSSQAAAGDPGSTKAEVGESSLRDDRFLDRVSHELRTPLNAIIGFTGMLLMKLSGPLNTDQERRLKGVQSNAWHLLSLIDDLVDLARIEAGTLEIKVEPVVCQELVAEVIKALSPLSEARGLELKSGMPQSEMVVRTDRQVFGQVLRNLSQTAIRLTGQGPVEIELNRQESGGRNITEIAVLGGAVQPPGAGGGSARGEGAGLALHVSRRLAALLGGEVVLKSERGGRTGFALVLEEK